MWAAWNCWAARSRRIWQATSWSPSRSPRPAAWACWWTGTGACSAPGGYLIQLLPGAPEGIIDRLEKGIMAAGPVTNLLMENDDPESLLRRVMADFELEILETVPVEYRCYCSRERMAAALVSLGRKQLTELAEDPNGIELTCQFCDSRQRFTPEEIRELLEKASEA